MSFASIVNKHILRQKFQDRRETSSARINRDSRDLLVRISGREDAVFVDAAVLLPLHQGAGGMEILLTKRAVHLRHHAGQVSFPGGRREPADAGLEHTALRETHEETGIQPEQVEIIGHLPRMYTISCFDVDPVVGLVRPGFELIPDQAEVESIFSVPLEFFSHRQNQRQVERNIGGTRIKMVEFAWEDHRIWGATAAMIMMLVDVLRSEDPDQ